MCNYSSLVLSLNFTTFCQTECTIDNENCVFISLKFTVLYVFSCVKVTRVYCFVSRYPNSGCTWELRRTDKFLLDLYASLFHPEPTFLLLKNWDGAALVLFPN